MTEYTLRNGVKVPAIGFGTYNPQDGDNKQIILDAMEVGYRYFDTASLYGTERALGAAIKESGLKRDELIIASKVWIDELGYESTLEACNRSIERLGMDYLDIYLIHWPRRKEGDTDWKQVDLDTWKAMTELKEQGKIKALGLSNFLPHHMRNLLENSEELPVVDQLELHPGYSQEKALSYCFENKVLPQAWSPLGRNQVLNNPLLKAMADKYGKCVAQICLRFLLQKGIMPLVKASTKERMRQNMDVFDFELAAEDLSILECMPQNLWLGEHPDFAIPTARSNPNQ